MDKAKVHALGRFMESETGHYDPDTDLYNVVGHTLSLFGDAFGDGLGRFWRAAGILDLSDDEARHLFLGIREDGAVFDVYSLNKEEMAENLKQFGLTGRIEWPNYDGYEHESAHSCEEIQGNIIDHESLRRFAMENKLNFVVVAGISADKMALQVTYGHNGEPSLNEYCDELCADIRETIVTDIKNGGVFDQ